MLNEKQNSRLPGMLMTWLAANPQSERSSQNIRRLVDMLEDETKEALFSEVQKDLVAQLKHQKSVIQDQIDRLEV